MLSRNHAESAAPSPSCSWPTRDCQTTDERADGGPVGSFCVVNSMHQSTKHKRADEPEINETKQPVSWRHLIGFDDGAMAREGDG
jgi:hypothetical protein